MCQEGARCWGYRGEGDKPTGAIDKSTHKCSVARHLPGEVCARRHYKQRLGLERSGESEKTFHGGGDVEQNREGSVRACQVVTGRR